MKTGYLLLITIGVPLLLFAGCIALYARHVAFMLNEAKMEVEYKASQARERERRRGIEESEREKTKKDKEEQAERARSIDLQCTAEEVSQAYDRNEVRADRFYKGRKVRITGTVKNVESGINDVPVVRLVGGFLGVALHDIRGYQASKLDKGDRVSVICIANGEILGSPIFKHCHIE